MTYRYIYKITCTNGSFKDKFYYGQRTTDIDPYKDEYKGSGKKLIDYYKKYPNDYIKEIIAFYNTASELNKAEYDIIHPYINDDNCLNLREGGNGGAPNEETRLKISNSLKGKSTWNKGRIRSEETKLKLKQSLTGRKLSKEHAKHISAALKGHRGYRNGLHNSVEHKRKQSETFKENKYKWMTDNIVEFRISYKYWHEFIDDGFTFGRLSKKTILNKI